jgi:2-dehydropantoate 2-reductase
VDNEPTVLRRFANVHGVCVMSPAAHLEPGVVACYSAPAYGILDVGRYPSGVDETDTALADAFRSANYGSSAVEDIRRPKYAKLLDNLANAVEALCSPGPESTKLAVAARQEGEAVLRASGIDWGADDPLVSNRRDGVYRLTSIDGERRTGGSTWQSLARGTGNIEVDHLNGEIVFLGRLAGIPTPTNLALQRAAMVATTGGLAVGSLSAESIMAMAGG